MTLVRASCAGSGRCRGARGLAAAWAFYEHCGREMPRSGAPAA